MVRSLADRTFQLRPALKWVHPKSAPRSAPPLVRRLQVIRDPLLRPGRGPHHYLRHGDQTYYLMLFQREGGISCSKLVFSFWGLNEIQNSLSNRDITPVNELENI